MSNRPVIDGIVLAAGASSRMGEPKPLLQAGDTTFIERAVHLLRDAGCRYVAAVVNDSDDWIVRLADTSGAAAIINDADGSEQIDSLRLGIANLPEDYDAIIVLPVDFPRVQPQTVQRLLERYAEQPAPVLNPVYNGQAGHPVIFSRDVVTELMRPDLPDGARTIVDRHRADAQGLEVDDAGVLIDIDTPADYEQHVSRDSNS